MSNTETMTMQPTTPVGPTVTNAAGYQVPATQQEHLKWWLSQVPNMTPALLPSEVTRFMIDCCTNEIDGKAVPESVRSNFLVLVAEKRMISMGMIATPWLNAMLAGLCTTPGEVVLYCYFLKLYSITANSNLVAVTDMPFIFPKGIPSKESLRTMWDLQKIEVKQGTIGDNLLDFITMRPSVPDVAR